MIAVEWKLFEIFILLLLIWHMTRSEIRVEFEVPRCEKSLEAYRLVSWNVGRCPDLGMDHMNILVYHNV